MTFARLFGNAWLNIYDDIVFKNKFKLTDL